jgi:pimeloyl-ACP methyl ester carboxylesterase
MMAFLDYRAASAAGERVLLLLLPGAGTKAVDFATEGLVADAQAGGIAVDVMAVQPGMGLYLDGGIAAALHEEIVLPAIAKGYRRIWLAGISLGGMGALLYAAAHETAIEGLILLAPFLGTKGTIAALREAGGIDAALPPTSIATETEHIMLAWLRDYAASGKAAPAVYLGYGEADRFAAGHRMLADALPPGRVAAHPGGHDWACWRALWRQVLALHPFGAA